MVTFIVILILSVFVYAIVSMSRTKSASPGQPSGRKYGKWIGGGLGWAFGGPIGAILGFSLGSLFDNSKFETNVYQGTARGDFAMSLLVLAAAVMKADGKVVRSELEYVKNFFLSQFGLTEAERLILMLREILKQEINVHEVSQQVGQYMDYPSRLQLLHFLFGIGLADGALDGAEILTLEEISGYMGITSNDFASIRAMFVKDINSAYDILEITPNTTNEEVKKAYRRLAVEYHPDKVAHLGEDIRKSATEKFQKLSAAYDEIKRQRGMN
jgi:DnaJ like chaperone protein